MSKNKAKPLGSGGKRSARIRRLQAPTDPTVIRAPWGDTDISEFFIGRENYKSVNRAEPMNGFRGRPILAAELGQVLSADCIEGSRITLEGRITAMRGLWRTLDESDELEVLAPVASVNDLTVAHGFFVHRAMLNSGTYKAAKTVLQKARHNSRLVELNWPAATSDVPLKEKDLPSPSAINTTYDALKRHVRDAHSRWDKCSELVARGTDLTKTKWTKWDTRRGDIRKWSLENRLATYSALDAVSYDVLNSEVLNEKLGHWVTASGKFKIQETAGYFYPVREEALYHLWLFLLKTGWNAQVALDLNIKDPNLATQSPTGPPKTVIEIDPLTGMQVRRDYPLMVLLGAKSRSGGELQSALSNSHQSTAPYPLLMRYIQQTKGLRAVVSRELEEAILALELDEHNRELQILVEDLKEDVVSPWLYRAQIVGEHRILSSPRSVMRLSLHNYHAGSSDGTSWSAFISGINAGIDRRIAANAVRLISESQQFAERQAALGVEIERAQRDGDQHALESAFAARAAFRVPGYLVPEKIPKTFTLSLLRDVFINNAYTSSGFNVFIAQAAAGHRSGSAIRDYLRNQTRRRQNYARGRHFQDHLFQEMRRGVVDPVILRKLMDDGEITEEQRHRWLAHRDRTRQGMGCRNPKRPPIEIAPEHKEGHDCRVQRCIICQLGLVFEDSVDPLSCRIAELLSIQMSMSLPVWEDSSFKLELAVTQATLGQAPFNAVEVAKRVQFWIEEIHSGRHLVADMEGTYA